MKEDSPIPRDHLLEVLEVADYFSLVDLYDHCLTEFSMALKYDHEVDDSILYVVSIVPGPIQLDLIDSLIELRATRALSWFVGRLSLLHTVTQHARYQQLSISGIVLDSSKVRDCPGQNVGFCNQWRYCFVHYLDGLEHGPLIIWDLASRVMIGRIAAVRSATLASNGVLFASHSTNRLTAYSLPTLQVLEEIELPCQLRFVHLRRYFVRSNREAILGRDRS